MTTSALDISSAQAENNTPELDARQQALIPIAAFTASGEIDKLKPALVDGLEAGLTVSEIREVMVQLYAYAGFPRSLNALGAFMAVLDERKRGGIQDPIGKEASPIPTNRDSLIQGEKIQTQLVGRPVSGALFTFAPAIDLFLKAHLFGDIFGRDNLDFKTREIATLAALSNMEGVASQLQAHFAISMNIGLSVAQLNALIAVIEAKVGSYQADRAAMTLAKALGQDTAETKAREITVTHTGEQSPVKGAEAWFTGSVTIDTPFMAPAPSHFYGASVNFDAGARTAWHTHELGQLLIVTSGVGRVQRWGGPVQTIAKGDVVWIPPFQKHWHGASSDSPMTHIAIVEENGIPSTQWLEKVSDAQYAAKPE